ncbi:rhodanese-like domain-containing protein [Mangrovivirga sp. M17]|uniref:Rhodanese-like domain-containing protein n=1 Tax=Mangrovivirga halotolerans TaxID=2993936 RepID=A0ABT3RRV7_9BACT|nr:rhodanese-like domain-containing protein [Mangrovivirga halotolerans]MCX2743905.1 rhodanese-like domain-containing protein [Mangrovivirga halotolerans]
MEIKRFYDKPLAQASYLIIDNNEAAVVDPARDPQPYLDYLKKKDAKLIAIFETHPHADFVSSHLELKEKTGARIYINPDVGVDYKFEPLRHNEEVLIGDLVIKALFTPGHSPDHNSYLLIDSDGKEHAVFTGDSLFIGDVGRPDLREGAGNIQLSRKELAGMMYDTINNVFKNLNDDVIVYPAHGAGSLCGKNMSDELDSTIGKQKETNWAFKVEDKDKFIEAFLEGQPFIPMYFPFDVDMNRSGAGSIEETLNKIPVVKNTSEIKKDAVLVDVRDEDNFKEGHLKGAINIQAGEEDKFETWLGSIVNPESPFYLIGDNTDQIEKTKKRVSKIGYEGRLLGTYSINGEKDVTDKKLDLDEFKNNKEKYTIVDIRNNSETEEGLYFDNAIAIPLPELKDRINEIPTDKPIVVHCAGGYRSAIGSSLLQKEIPETTVYDLSDDVEKFK